MRNALLVLILVLVLMLVSLTGLAYCWQQDLTETTTLIWFVVSLAVLLGAISGGVVYAVVIGLRKTDEYLRDLSSASIEAAKETAEETVENLPGTVMDGIEKSLKRTRDRWFGKGDRGSSEREGQFTPRNRDASESLKDLTPYRDRIDRAMDESREARKRRSDD